MCALSLFSAVRNLERIADHATNIAEETVFLVEGESLRHKQCAGPEPGHLLQWPVACHHGLSSTQPGVENPEENG